MVRIRIKFRAIRITKRKGYYVKHCINGQIRYGYLKDKRKQSKKGSSKKRKVKIINWNKNSP
jgi:hypothetical protein